MNAYSYINGKTSHVNMGDVSVPCDFTTEIPVKRNDICENRQSGRVSATHVLVEKRCGNRERLVAGHLNLQAQ